jgi:uncharacterized protein (UPF0335 family)
VFKIIEEFSTGADEQMEGLRDKIEKLEIEKREVERANEGLKGEVLMLRESGRAG